MVEELDDVEVVVVENPCIVPDKGKRTMGKCCMKGTRQEISLHMPFLCLDTSQVTTFIFSVFFPDLINLCLGLLVLTPFVEINLSV